MGWKAVLAGACAAAMMSVAAAAAQDMPDGVRELVWTPPLDMAREDVRAANDRCLTSAWEAHERMQSLIAAPYYDGSGGVYGAVGASMGYAIVAGISNDIAKQNAYDYTYAACFQEAGFIQLGLSGRERREWRQAALLVRQQEYTSGLLRANPGRAISPAILPDRPNFPPAGMGGGGADSASNPVEGATPGQTVSADGDATGAARLRRNATPIADKPVVTPAAVVESEAAPDEAAVVEPVAAPADAATPPPAEAPPPATP